MLLDPSEARHPAKSARKHSTPRILEHRLQGVVVPGLEAQVVAPTRRPVPLQRAAHVVLQVRGAVRDEVLQLRPQSP